MPGMTKIIFKNLFSKPATRLYPTVKRDAFPTARGRMVFARMENCVFCSLCAKYCPSVAITIDREGKKNTLDPLKCIQCGMCAEVCLKDVIDMAPEYHPPLYHKHNDVAVQTYKAEKPKPADAVSTSEFQPTTQA